MGDTTKLMLSSNMSRGTFLLTHRLWKEIDVDTRCLSHVAEVVCPYVFSRGKGWINEDIIPDIPGGFQDDVIFLK